jgi:hypothetical protein
MTRSMESRLQELLDKEDIREVLRRYTRGLDRHDGDVIASAFWPDAEVNYLNDFSGPTDAFVEWGNRHHEQTYVVHQHHITNVNIDLADDVAHVSSYVIYMLRTKDDQMNVGSGRYIDRFERRGDEWRISVREFLPEMRFVAPAGARRELPNPPGNSRWDRQDLSYRRPLERRDRSGA